MHTVAVLALADVVAFDLSIPAQVFGHHDEAAHYELAVCGVAPGPVATTTGFAVVVDHGLELLERADTVIVPGFSPATAPPPIVLEALRALVERGGRTISVCTGAFALAAAGILDGRRATTHWGDAARLAAKHPAVEVDPDVLWVDEGQVLTSAGVAAGIDLCLHVVRLDLGEAEATRIARRMVVAPHRTEGQAQYVERPVPTPGTGLAGTCAWAAARLGEPLGVADLAAHSGWAPRTFARRFVEETGTTPARWLAGQRLAEARRLLEVSDLPVETVASRSGLGSAANLRHHLLSETGSTPTTYRRAYRGAGRSG